jgi:hypothetical protein
VIRAISAAAALVLSAAASPIAAQAPAPPKLIVVISVDQFSADLFAQYRAHFDGGLKRLAEGAVFPSGYQAHALTKTCPGHATILTGARPARTGIVGNRWYDLATTRADKRIYCAEDESAAGSSSSDYVPSDVHLLTPTLGGRMKAANPASRVVSVAGKDRSALMMGGPQTDQTLWWGDTGFVTPRGQQPRPVVAQVNAGVMKALAAPRPPMALPDFCRSRSRAVTAGDQQVGEGRFGRPANDIDQFRYSPEFDAATLALAAALIDDMKLGQGGATDLISIGLSATDHVGHAYGSDGSEMCLQLATIDADIGAFLDRLDATGIDYLVALTADHGGQDLPERLRMHAVPDAQRSSADLSADALGSAIGETLGLTGPVLFSDGAFGDYYVDRALSPPQRQAVMTEARRRLSAHPQVAAFFSADDLADIPAPSGAPDAWSLAERVKAGYYPGRSGDFILLPRPRVTAIATPRRHSVATHGTPWDYDRRVPILFWRRGMTGFEQALAVDTVDIMPTLAALIGLPVPTTEIDGRCLDLDAGPGSTCPLAR